MWRVSSLARTALGPIKPRSQFMHYCTYSTCPLPALAYHSLSLSLCLSLFHCALLFPDIHHRDFSSSLPLVQYKPHQPCSSGNRGGLSLRPRCGDVCRNRTAGGESSVSSVSSPPSSVLSASLSSPLRSSRGMRTSSTPTVQTMETGRMVCQLQP